MIDKIQNSYYLGSFNRTILELKLPKVSYILIYDSLLIVPFWN